MDNKYVYHSKLTEVEFESLLKCFCLDLTSMQAAALLGLNRNTINRYYLKLRKLICSHYNDAYYLNSGICEIDESYFGSKRVRGKAGRGSYGKIVVFGIIQRGGSAYTEVVSTVSASTLILIITSHISTACIINSDSFTSYNRLSELGYTHHRVNHSSNEFVNGTKHTNTIESFWSYCKQRLHKFRGISKTHYQLHIKECECRFNLRKADIYAVLLELLCKYPLHFK
jgi:transposase